MFIVRIVVNALTCPVIISLNILVMVSVATNPQLCPKSNIALACLSTTDIVVGLVTQPLHIASANSLLRGEHNMLCAITNLSKVLTMRCLLASFHHLVLISAERYVAIKHPFAYRSKITESRIVIASALAWVVAIIIPSGNSLITTKLSKTILTFSVMLLAILPVYFNVAVCK